MSDSEYLSALVRRVDELHDSGMDYLACREGDEPASGAELRQLHRGVTDRVREVEALANGRLLNLARECSHPEPERFGVSLRAALRPLYQLDAGRFSAGMVRVQELLCELLDMRGWFATGSAAVSAAGNEPATRRVPRAEANERVAAYLMRHGKRDPGAVRVAAVARETGVSSGAVSKCPAWRAFHEKRKVGRGGSGHRTAALTGKVLAMVPDKAAHGPAELALQDDSELTRCIREQARDMEEENRPRKRRV